MPAPTPAASPPGAMAVDEPSQGGQGPLHGLPEREHVGSEGTRLGFFLQRQRWQDGGTRRLLFFLHGHGATSHGP